MDTDTRRIREQGKLDKNKEGKQQQNPGSAGGTDGRNDGNKGKAK